MTEEVSLPPNRFFTTYDLTRQLPRPAAERLSGSLALLWEAAFDRPMAGIRPDLDDLREYFDPVAQGKRLRGALAKIRPTELPGPISPVQAIRVGGDRHLITPEGRVAAELIRVALRMPGPEVDLDQGSAARWELHLLNLYRSWSRHRLNSVVDLLGGGVKPLQLPSIGAALTLLANRVDEASRSIQRFPPGTARDVVDRVFRRCANSFAQQIASSQRRVPDKERLTGGWLLGEISRRMPEALHNSDEEGVFVDPDHRKALMQLMVFELKRRQVDAETFEDAFDALIEELRSHSQELAGFGLLFERPANTRLLRQELLDSWTRSS